MGVSHDEYVEIVTFRSFSCGIKPLIARYFRAVWTSLVGPMGEKLYNTGMDFSGLFYFILFQPES